MGIPPVIEGTNLTIGYGPEVILSKVDIVIQDGVLMPFVGLNGAGKSTILKEFLGPRKAKKAGPAPLTVWPAWMNLILAILTSNKLFIF